MKDVQISFDAAADLVPVSIVDRSQTEDELKIISIPAHVLATGDPERVCGFLGKLVMRCLVIAGGARFKDVAAQIADAKEVQEADARVVTLAHSGNPQAQYCAGMNGLYKSIEDRDPARIAAALTWFQQSAAAGFAPALEMTEDWNTVEAGHLTLIRRKRGEAP